MDTGMRLKIALVDDHKLFRRGMVSLVEMIDEKIEVLFEADDGKDMQRKIDRKNLPEIILMDINMPGMDGYAAVDWLNKIFPSIKVLVISMVQDEESVIRMLKLGVKGFLSKDVEPNELRNALVAINSKGFYYTDFITGKLVHTLQQETEKNVEPDVWLSDKEKEFIRFACSDLTYLDIAKEMFLSPKTIEGYRYSLFEKLQVKSRVGLALYAVKYGLVTL